MGDPFEPVTLARNGERQIGGHTPAELLRNLVPGLSLRPFQFPSLQHLDERVESACADGLTVEGLSPATTEAYRTAYGRLRLFLVETATAERFLRGNLEEQRQVFEGWIAWIRTSGANHTTVNTYFRNLHGVIIRIARRDGLVDPTALVVAPAPGRPYVRFLTKPTLEEVFAFVRNYQWCGGEFARDRNLAMLAVMALGGCRLGEVVRMEVADVNLGERTIAIKKGKGRRGGKPRTVYMPFALQAALDLYLTRRKARDLVTTTLFVATSADRPIQADTVRRLCSRITTRTGIKVAPHMLRHTAATLMRQSDIADRLAMDQLGHASLVALQRYSHVANGELKQAITKIDVDIGVL